MKSFSCIFVIIVCCVCSGVFAFDSVRQKRQSYIRPPRQVVYYRPVISGYYPQRVQYIQAPQYFVPQYSAWDLSRKRREAVPSTKSKRSAINGLGYSNNIFDEQRVDAFDNPKFIEQSNDYLSNSRSLGALSRSKRQDVHIAGYSQQNVDDSEGHVPVDQDKHHFRQRYSMWDLARRKRQVNQVLDSNENHKDDIDGTAQLNKNSRNTRQGYSMWDLSRRKRQVRRYSKRRNVIPHYTKWDLSS